MISRNKFLDHLQKIGLISFGIILGIIGLEVLGRAFSNFIPYQIQNNMQIASMFRSDSAHGLVTRVGESQISGPEFTYVTITRDLGCNNRGFRDDGLDKQTLRILALGDSFTWGAGVAVEESWPEVLEQSTQIDVINAGFGGTGTTQQLILLKECGSTFDPDIIIVAFFLNDFADNTTWQQELNLDNYWYTNFVRPIRIWLATNSYAYQFFKYYILGIDRINQEEIDRHFVIVKQDNLNLHLNPDTASYFISDFELYDQAISLVNEALSEIAQEADKLHSKFLVVVLSAKEQVYWQYLAPNLPANIPYDVNHPNNIVVNLATENQIAILDLNPVFAANNQKQLFGDMDGHMNSVGYRLTAESIEDFLLTQGWISK